MKSFKSRLEGKEQTFRFGAPGESECYFLEDVLLAKQEDDKDRKKRIIEKIKEYIKAPAGYNHIIKIIEDEFKC